MYKIFTEFLELQRKQSSQNTIILNQKVSIELKRGLFLYDIG